MSLRVSIPQLKDTRLYQVIRDIAAAAIDGRVRPLFVDESNQLVGVGTASPRAAVKLDVSGGDIGVATAGAGLNVTTPDGSKTYRIFVDNTGALSVVRLTLFLLAFFLSSSGWAQSAVGSTTTYAGLQSTQTYSAQSTFLNALTVSSDEFVTGDLHISGRILPATGTLTAAVVSSATFFTTSPSITNTMGTFPQISTLTVTTDGNPVYILFHCTSGYTTTTFAETMGVIVDGAYVDGEDSSHGFVTYKVFASGGSTAYYPVSFSHLIPLSAAVHKFAIVGATLTSSYTDSFNSVGTACGFSVSEIP